VLRPIPAIAAWWWRYSSWNRAARERRLADHDTGYEQAKRADPAAAQRYSGYDSSDLPGSAHLRPRPSAGMGLDTCPATFEANRHDSMINGVSSGI